MWRRAWTLCTFACLCVGAACDGAQAERGLPGGDGAAGTVAARQPGDCDVEGEVFARVCGTSVCHEGTVNGLDLIAPDVDARLLDVPAAGFECADSGLRIVDSEQPQRSLLLLKLSEAPPCGSPMPLGSGPAGLTTAQRACIDGHVQRLVAP